MPLFIITAYNITPQGTETKALEAIYTRKRFQSKKAVQKDILDSLSIVDYFRTSVLLIGNDARQFLGLLDPISHLGFGR
jgi:hypothetical protein